MRTRPLILGLLSLGLGACTVGSTGPGPGGDDTVGGDDTTTGANDISGSISSDQTWSGTVTIVGDTTIEAGATVTVEAGTEILGKNGFAVHVTGSLEAVGTDASHISIMPAPDAQTFSGFVADSGGSVHIAYADGTGIATFLYCHQGAALCSLDHVDVTHVTQAIVAEGTATLSASHVTDTQNGGVMVRGGNLTVTDSYIKTSSGDLVVANGGTLDVEYSEIGDTQGSYDHCDTHIGSASSLTITHSNLVDGVYGMMLGGTTGANLTYNNWMGNTTDLDPVGTNSTVNLQHNYWANGAPNMGAGYDVSNPELAQIVDAGPRI